MLFTTIAEIQKHLSIGNDGSMDRFSPHILNAETKFMKPLLLGMFDELQEFYEAKTERPEDPDAAVVWDDMTELIGKCQKSIIHLAFWIGFQNLNATISSSGFKRTESDKLKSLFKYQEDELKTYFRNAGFDAMDEVLSFIEENISSFAEFKASANYTLIRQSFIPDTKTFDGIVHIAASRLTFLRLRNHMNLVEDMEIYPILGSDIYIAIKQEMVKDTPDEKVLKILPYIRKPIAYLSSALLMEESGADLTEKGLYFDATRAIDTNTSEHQPSTDSRIGILVSRNRSIGNIYLDQLKSYLAANVTDWPSYASGSSSVIRRDNTDKKTFWNPIR